MKLQIIKKRNLFFIFSSTLVVVSLLSWIAWGLKPGIDFTGGSLMEVQFKERPSNDKITASLKDFNLGDVSIQQSGNSNVIIRFKNVDEDVHSQVVAKLKEDFSANTEKQKQKNPANAEEPPETKTQTKDGLSPGDISITDENGNVIKDVSVSAVNDGGEAINADNSVPAQGADESVSELRFDSIGASVGQELRAKSFKAMLYAVIAIILYVAWAFRKVSRPVKSWKYGIVAIIALLHDISITIGVFVFLGHFLGTEINTPFIAALLTVFGYSVNDTIVVFDRIRENLHHYHENFEETVNDSINETFVRSLNTSLTTIIALLAVYFFGGASIKDFALALIVGLIAGTYSSIFIACPLLVTWHKISEKIG